MRTTIQFVKPPNFELLNEIPIEILYHILFDYCDGKSLSTLYLTLIGSNSCFYYNFAKNIIPLMAKYLLHNIACELDSETQGSSRRDTVSSWIRLIAGINDTEFPNEKCSIPIADFRIGKELQKRLYYTSEPIYTDRIIHRNRILQSMRYTSENFAAIDFLRQCIRDSQPNQWVWPIWVGQISVSFFSSSSHIDVAMEQPMAKIVILAPMDFPSHILGSRLLYQHRTPTGTFRCERMNLTPLPPWGKMRGLQLHDDMLLRRISCQMDEIGMNHVLFPTQQDALDIRILSNQSAQNQLANFPHLGTHPQSAWLLNDDSISGGNNMNGKVTCGGVYPLICCWQYDSTDDTEPREYINYLIKLMKTRDRLLRESNRVTNNILLEQSS